MRLALATAMLALAAPPAAAQSPLPAGLAATSAVEPVRSTRLLPGWRRADGAFVAALEVRLAPGWHTYWRVPGEAGIPPEFDWSGSENLAAVGYEWPRPQLIDGFGIESFGYAGTLLLPLVLTPERADAPVEADLRLFFGVCKEICLPAEARLEARLDGRGAPEARALIEGALAERPLTPAEAGVERVECGLAAGPGGAELTAEVTFAAELAPGQRAVIETGRADARAGFAESSTEGRTLVARAPLVGAGAAALDRSAMRVTVLDARRAVDIHGCDGPG